jgi:hypothetical protein
MESLHMDQQGMVENHGGSAQSVSLQSNTIII